MSTTLYTLLQRSAAEHGDHPAVDFGDRVITYSELLAAADRFATLAARHGAAPGRRVAFCFRKSIDALVALFGVIRTGATYVPLDPAWPAERRATICRDAGVGLWVGSAGPDAGLDDITAIATDPGDGGAIEMSTADDCPRADDPPAAPADGLSNILYTSGSTGRPKGVQITELSLLHFSQWAVDYFTITPQDRLANHAPYNFDLSTLDIFAAVRAGAAMCPVPEQTRMFPFQMARFIADRRITVWYSVPSALIMMQARGRLREHDLLRLRHVIFAGEVMPKPALQALVTDIPHAAFTNLYGPTETNVCTFHRVMPEDLANDDPVPIGVPISDTRLWIVDDAGGSAKLCFAHRPQEVADAASGELWVAGPTLTSGYHGDADLTARRLVPAPDGVGHAYRTGDRVRRRGDGVLMFEGRMDRMIKTRGHRVEPGEIEAVLSRHPRVREAAVVPVPDLVFGCRIKACVAVEASHAAELEPELASYCRERLPAYMAPDVWQFLDALPRTDRGKIDLAALAR